jgi:hypothetical protein
MKCVAKTVTGAIAEIEVEPTDTLAELKVRFLVLRQRQRCDSSRLANPTEGETRDVDGFLCEECADIFYLLLLFGWVETVKAKIEAKL